VQIGLITGEYHPMQGGVGDFSQELARTMVALGHTVHVITGQGKGSESPAQDSELWVHRAIEGWGWGCWRQIMMLAGELGLDVLNVQYQAAAYGMHPAINFVPRRQRPDRPPVVVTFHDLKVPYLFPKAGPLRWQVVRAMARRADRVIVTNREDYIRLEAEMSTKCLKLIPIGSNISVDPPTGYDREVERASWGVAPNDLLLGYFGFLNESKGGEELIQALAHLVEWRVPVHLLMIGGRVGSSDPANRKYADRMDHLISELGLGERVHWTGYSRPAGVSAALLATDICVMPYRDGVSFRRGTLHACLVHGRAIVTTHPAVPLPEARDGENMMLVAPRDSWGLAEAVKALASDLTLRERLEAGAEALAAEFTWERIARMTVALFRGLERGPSH
jgi:glycosyltransferase involved in cell wall biosynthesis